MKQIVDTSCSLLRVEFVISLRLVDVLVVPLFLSIISLYLKHPLPSVNNPANKGKTIDHQNSSTTNQTQSEPNHALISEDRGGENDERR